MAAIVILGVILTSITIARNRFVRQLSVTTQKRQVIAALDQTINYWLADGSIPINKRGNLAGVPGCVWQTRALPMRAENDLLLQVVRVQVIDYRIHPEVMAATEDDESIATNAPPVVSIDLVTKLPSRDAGGAR